MRVKGCLRLRLIALAIATTLLSGCAREASDHSACPPVVEYSAEIQERAAAEIEVLQPGTVMEGMLADYHVLRRQARACQAKSHRTSSDSLE